MKMGLLTVACLLALTGLASNGVVVIEPTMSALGSDLSSLPAAYPDADWLPLEGPVLPSHLVVTIEIDDRSVLAFVDTGAEISVMGRSMARTLELNDDGREGVISDSNGEKTSMRQATLPKVKIGSRIFRDQQISVVDDDIPMFIVGADLLYAFDLYVAADDGVLGLFPAGTAPFPAGANIVNGTHHRALLVLPGRAPGKRSPAVFQLVVDTGANTTSVPSRIGIAAGVKADLKFRATSRGLASESVMRGRFVLDPLGLGDDDVNVNHVYALAGTIQKGQSVGLLGNDVMTRFDAVISLSRALVALSSSPVRPSVRSRGPENQSCGDTPCIRVSFANRAPQNVVDGDRLDRCLLVDVHPRYRGRTLELAVVGHDERGRLPGGFRVQVTVGPTGISRCLALPRSSTRTWPDDAQLSIARARTERVRWSCDPMADECIVFTGPVPDHD